MKNKMKYPHILHAIGGFILGAAVFGGSVLGAPAKSAGFAGRSGAAEWAETASLPAESQSGLPGGDASIIVAHPKTASVVIDGAAVDLKGYLIDGSHYFQLRDISIGLKPGGKDFSVVWDGQGKRIVIDTGRGYDPDEQYAPPAPAQAPVPAHEPEMALDEMKEEIVRLTNIERAKAGLPELIVLPKLMETAQAKAEDFRVNSYYGHTSPVYGTPSQMIRAAIPGAGPCAENLAPWARTPAEAFAGWVESPAHYAIILNAKYTHMGVGILEGADGGYWWVQHFVGL